MREVRATSTIAACPNIGRRRLQMLVDAYSRYLDVGRSILTVSWSNNSAWI